MPKRNMTRRSVSTVDVSLTNAEIEDLLQLAGYYERSMGVMRHVVRLTSSRPIRQRFDFVAEESRLLRAFAQSLRDNEPDGSHEVAFTPRSLVAFWGRALSSLNSKRSRRRMSAERLAGRQLLAEKLGRGVEKLWLRDPATVAREMSTRRAPEVAWMREQLEGQSS